MKQEKPSKCEWSKCRYKAKHAVLLAGTPWIWYCDVHRIDAQKTIRQAPTAHVIKRQREDADIRAILEKKREVDWNGDKQY